jgi:putative ABC transport system ATP-binding protein
MVKLQQSKKVSSRVALTFQSVSKRYRKELALLESVSFDLNYGEIVVIAGPSGSGKSTVLQIASGLISPDSGTVTVNGIVLEDSRESRQEISKMRRSALSYVPQDDYLFETLTVGENVALAFDLHREKRDQQKIHGTLASLGIEKLAERSIAEISAGERRRVSIARGIVRSPKLVIMDEPTSALDIERTIDLMKFFRDATAKSNAAFLIASHDVNELKEFADRTFGIKETRLVPLNA